METENQVDFEVAPDLNLEAQKETTVLPLVDLNRATEAELMTLEGVGPTLAQRILAYREMQGPFESPAILKEVPGIGEVLYERWASRLQVEPVAAAEPEDEPEPTPVLETLFPDPLHLNPPAAPTFDPLPELESEPAPEPEPPVAPDTSPTPVVASTNNSSFWAWLWASLAGALLGMVFTLLVLSGINGSLDINHSEAVLDLRSQSEALAGQIAILRSDATSLRQRLDTLEGLTVRMQAAESEVAALREQTLALEEHADAVDAQLGVFSTELETVQSQAERGQRFFERLQELLQEIFGEGPQTPPASGE